MSARLIATLALVLVLPYAAANTHRSETKAYDATSGIIQCPDAPSNGGACFVLQGNEKRVSIVVTDMHGLTVGAAYGFTPQGVSNTAFCGSATTTVPPLQEHLFVFVMHPISEFSCFLSAPPTRGTVTATFS